MRAGRWMGAAVAALAVAIMPGAIRLVPASQGVERAQPMDLAAPEARRPAVATPMAAPPTTAATPASAELAAPPPAPNVEVAITPPEVLTGELAPVVPAPAPFEQARGGGRAG